jgi:hypothetical protein
VADGGKAALDQRLDCGVGPGDRGEHLTDPIRRLNVAEADLEMARARLAAPDESRVQGQGDRRRWSRRLGRGSVAQPSVLHGEGRGEGGPILHC